MFFLISIISLWGLCQDVVGVEKQFENGGKRFRPKIMLHFFTVT